MYIKYVEIHRRRYDNARAGEKYMEKYDRNVKMFQASPDTVTF